METLLQYSCLENPMDRGVWWATVYGFTKSGTRLKWLTLSLIEDKGLFSLVPESILKVHKKFFRGPQVRKTLDKTWALHPEGLHFNLFCFFLLEFSVGFLLDENCSVVKDSTSLLYKENI